MEKFMAPEIDVIKFVAADVIATSNECDTYTECGSETSTDWD